MAVRVDTPFSGSTPSSAPRAAASSALERLLDPDAAPEIIPTATGPGRVVVVRGFDVNSREFRGTVTALAKQRGLDVLDIASAPAFGAIPDADDIRLVAVARSSLLPLAQRCAAFWNAPVLGPAVAGSDAALVARAVPGLRVVVWDRPADGVATRLALAGPVRYRIAGGPVANVESFAVEPSSAGILVQTTDAAAETLRVIEHPITFVLERDTEAMLDTTPVLLPAGEYLIEARADAFRRIVHA